MGFFHGKTSKQTSRLKKLLELALSRLAIARRPRLFRRSICRGDVGQLLSLGGVLEDKFGGDFAAAAKEGAGIVDPMLVWKLSGDKTNMELKKKVTKEIAAENSVLVDFSELQEQEGIEQD